MTPASPAELSTTITQEKDKAAQDAAKAVAAANAADEAIKAAKAPLTAAEQLAARIEATELDRERVARLRREVESLQKRLSVQGDHVASERAGLEADRKAFAAATANAVEQTRSGQFQKAMGVLSSLKPAAAKSVLTKLLESRSGLAAALPSELASAALSPPPERIAEVVMYLDAMEDRPRTKIMTEFAKDDPVLASKLLERLRDKGEPKGQPTSTGGSPAPPPAKVAADLPGT